jgi:hypothetical protein
MTRSDDYKVIKKNDGSAIRKALGLPASAPEADIIAAIEAKKQAVADAKHAVATAKYRASDDYKKSIAERELQQTTTNVARSYMKQAASDIEEARRNALANDPVVKAELRKLSSRHCR